MTLLLIITLITALLFAARADSHLVAKPHGTSLKARETAQMTNLYHARYVCRHGAAHHRRWACKARKWLARELRETRAKMKPKPTSVGYWVAKQIAAAEAIARGSAGDPWPNCPDPHDGSGASWYQTVACENGGSWYDSPGYYRCGLQFDPGWERRFGRLCP